MSRPLAPRATAALAAMALTVALGAGVAAAVEPDEMLSDPSLEARAQHISKELRCVVCQNQNIDDSAAPLSRDMRLSAGDSDEQAKAFLVARYGNFVLLRPPFQPNTWALWLGPFAILGVAGAALVFASRTGAVDPADDAVEDDPLS